MASGCSAPARSLQTIKDRHVDQPTKGYAAPYRIRMLLLVGNIEKAFTHTGQTEPELGQLLLGDGQLSSELGCEAPSLSKQFSSLCAVNVTCTSLNVQNLYKN